MLIIKDNTFFGDYIKVLSRIFKFFATVLLAIYILFKYINYLFILIKMLNNFVYTLENVLDYYKI